MCLSCVWFAGQLLCDPVRDTRSRPAGRQGRGGLRRASRGDFCKWSNGWIIQQPGVSCQAYLYRYCKLHLRWWFSLCDWIRSGPLMHGRELNCPFAWSALSSRGDLGRVCCSYGSWRLFLLYSCAQEQSPLMLQTSTCRLIGGVWDGVSGSVGVSLSWLGFWPGFSRVDS